MHKMPSNKVLKSLFRYDPSSPSGLTRIASRPGIRGGGLGCCAGNIDKDGYWNVGWNYCQYKVHRIIYKLFYGKEPETIDHIDGNPSNNVIENLRAATYRENQLNRKVNKNNSSGYTGVSWHKHHKKWRAQLRLNGIQTSLGIYSRKSDAIHAVDLFMQTHDAKWRRTKTTPRKR